jgi:hypothetical protein
MHSARLKHATRFAAPLAALALIPGLTVLAGPARAASTLSVSISCEYIGGGIYECTGSAGGGTSPYQYAWSGTLTGRPPGPEVVWSACIVGRSLNLTVTDAIGDQGTAVHHWLGSCRTGPAS